MALKIDLVKNILGDRIEIEDEIKEMLSIIKDVQELFSKNNIKVWFNGTFGVVGYAGYFFDKPADIDCGVLEKDFAKANQLLGLDGFQKTIEKDNGKFKVCSYIKNGIVLEIGTFKKDLGDKYGIIKDVKYSIPNAKWLAECYEITARKERRKGKNDRERAIFLKGIK